MCAYPTLDACGETSLCGCLPPAACAAMFVAAAPPCCAVVFWGGPIMQAYDLLRTSVRSVSIKALRPATAAEIERMHGDCAICWCEMTVAPSRGGAAGSSSSSSGSSAAASTAAGAAALGNLSASAAAGQDAAAGAAVAAEDLADIYPAAVPGQDAEQQHAADMARAGSAGVEQLQAGSAAALLGYTLPCSHAYHQQCLNQVRRCSPKV